MNKIPLFLAIILVILALFFTLKYVSAGGENYLKFPETQTHSFTKAVCNESNLCQDYYFECNQSEMVSISPITGAIVQFDKNWQDPRSEELKNKVC